MATRPGYVGTQAVGDVLTSANFTKLPNGCVAYAQLTTRVPGITAEADVGLSITYTFPASRLYRVSAFVPELVQNTSNGVIKVIITDNASAHQVMVCDETVLSGARCGSRLGAFILAPGAGSATYKVRASTSAGSVDFECNPAGTEPGPAYIMFEDLGPAF